MDLNTPESTANTVVSRKNNIQVSLKNNLSLRLVVQGFVVAVMIYAAWYFYGFYQFVQGYEVTTDAYRPPVVEGFLPVAAIVAFKALFVTGTIDPIHPAGLVIFLAILITSLIFRRALCSWICPLGTLSEYLAKLGRKLMGRNFRIPKWLDIILIGLKYVVFIYIARMFILMPGTEAVAFMEIPYYTISDVKMFELFLRIGFTGALFIVVMMTLSFLFKNFWCRYLCPYGALLGILSVFSPLILKKSDKCIQCGRCNDVCPSVVNIQQNKSMVITSECTGCTSCVSACPVPGTLEFKLFGVVPVKPLIFAVGFLALFFGIIVLAMVNGYWESSASPYEYQYIYRMMSGGVGGF